MKVWMKEDINNLLKDKWFALLIVGAIIALIAPIHEFAGVYSNSHYGLYDIAMMVIGISCSIISVFMLSKKIPDYAWHAMLIAGLVFIIGVPVNEIFAGNGFYGIYETFAFVAGGLLISLALFGIYDKNPLMLGMLGAFIGSVVAVRYNPYDLGNWFFYAVMFAVFLFFLLFWCFFEPEKLNSGQSISIASAGILAIILMLHEMMWPNNVWSISWFILTLAFVPPMIFSLFLYFRPEHPWMKSNWWIVGCITGIFILSFFMRAYFNFEPAVGRGFSFVGTDPYYHARSVGYVVETKQHLIWDNLLNYPYISSNPRPPLFVWSAAIFGLILAPFFGWDAYTSSMYALTVLPALWGALTIIPIYYLTKEFFNKKAGVIAAFIIATMPNHIQGTGLGLSDHDPMYMFFVVLAFFFFVKALKASNQKKWVVDWRKGRDIKNGFGVLFSENKTSLGYAVMAGFSLLTVALIWKGYIYVFAILLIYYILQLVINHIRHEDSLGLCVIMLITTGIPIFLSLFSAPYFRSIPGILQGSLPSEWYLFIVIIGASILFVPTRDAPWVIVIPSIAAIGGAGYAGMWHFLPGPARSIFGGMGYFIKTKVYGTIGEAQATDVSMFAFAYGHITFYLAMVALFLLIIEYLRFWKKDRLLMVVWAATAIYMTMGAIRFLFPAAPVFAILSGWMVWEIIRKIDFRTMTKNVHGMRGNKIYALKKGVKFRHVACVLFLVVCIVLPNCMGAIDASIPYEKKSEYDKMIYDWLPDFAKPSDYSGSWYLGAHGQGFLSDYWFDGLKWLSTQDTDVPVEERPAFIAWWDYGFQCVQDGKHPTIADNFQNGIPPAGNFITAQNESKAISVLITRILSAEYTKHGKINDDVNNVLLLHLGSNDSKTLEDIIKNPGNYVDYVLENPDKCGKRTSDIAEKGEKHPSNLMYAAAMILLGEKGEEFVVNLLGDLQDITGHSIRYFAADARMFPFSWSNTGIFYAPTVLSDQDVNDFFETFIIGMDEDQSVSPPIKTTTVPMTAKEFIEWRDNAPPEHIRYASDYELKYKEQFYNSMFYKGYIGYSGKDIGSDGIPGLSPALANYPPMPGWMMKHFRLVYLNSGLRILKYYEGAYVNGTVVTEDGNPVPNVYVTVLDDFGIPHDTVSTNETGCYSLIVPFGMKENNYNVSIILSAGNIHPLYKCDIQNPLKKETLHVKEEDAFSRKQIMLNFTIKGASVHGKVSWDDGETASNGTVLLKTDTKTFTENISSNGEYRFDDLAPATYKLWLNTSGHEFHVRDVTPVSDTDKTGDITLKGRVSGSLGYDEKVNVTISLFDETNQTWMNVTVNDTYSYDKLLPGDYTLTVDEDNYLKFTSSVTIDLNDEKTVNITLQSSVFVSGNTIYNNTEIMKNVTLRFKGVMNATAVSDETGFYQLKLIPGTYSISSTYVDNNVVYVFNELLEIDTAISKNICLKKGERIYGYVCYEKYGENNTVNETSGENKTVNETLSNVHITFKSDNIIVKAVSNSTGYYEVYLPKDNYTILVSYEYNETSTLVFLQPFNTTEKKRNITLIEGIKVYGILHYDLDETYDKTVAALILFGSENGTVETTSDADGYYIVYLAVGNYNVSVNVSGFNPNPFNNKTFVNKTIVTTIVNETTNETVNTTKNEMWYNISLNPEDVNVSLIISSILQLNLTNVTLTNVTISFNASDDVGINNSITNMTLNETVNNYSIMLNPGNYNIKIEHNITENATGNITDVSYYNYTMLSIDVGEENITLNITVEKKIKINGTVWIDLNDNGKMDIINETNHIVINEICYNTSDPKAVWFELYNPTNSSVNITGWKIQFSSNTFTIPSWTIESGEYIIVCWDEDNFTSYWNVSNETKIIELGDWSLMSDLISIKNATTTIDMINDSLPLLPLNHSWSRYNGYDTGNFTDDFYDEINPTPGYENTKSKTEVIENATIEFITGNVSYTVQSDVNGTYEIYLKHGNYTLFVKYLLENATHNITYDEFGNVTFDNVTYNNITYVYLNLTSFSVGNSTHDIQLEEAVNVSGFTYYEENNDGMPNNEMVSVNITFTSNITNASRTVTSNDTGYYQLYLPPGNYTLKVNEITYPAYGNATYTRNESLEINEDLPYNISLIRNVTIRVKGTIWFDKDKNGEIGDNEVIGNATVVFENEGIFNTSTDEKGKYEVYLNSGNYNVTVEDCPGFEVNKTSLNVSTLKYSLDVELLPSNVPIYGVTYYDVNDNGVYDNEDVLITNATISFTGTLNITVTSNGCYNTILPIGEYTVYANYVTPWNTSYGYFGQIPPIEPTPYQQLDIALIRSVNISGHIYYYNMTGKNNATLVNITFIRDKGTDYEASKTIEGNASYEIYLVPGIYTISASYTTFEHNMNMNITYSYDRTIEISESIHYDINLTKVRECKLGLHWNKTENQTFEPINQGGSVVYSITVTNNGNENDTFVLSAEKPEGWDVSFSKNTVTLGLNESGNITVNINASINALAYNNTITIKAVSQNVSQDGTHASNTTDLIVAVKGIDDDIDIRCEESEKWIFAGGSVKFILSIENNGNNNENDLISLTVDPLPKGWNASLDSYRPSILGGKKTVVTLTVTASSDAKLDDYTNIHLYATLERNNSIVSSKVLKAVISLPDLIIKNITFSKSHPKIGEDLTINATVYNIGHVDAFSADGFEARFYVDDKLINTTYINQTTILVGENITLSADWNTTGTEPGWKTIKVSVRAYNGTLDELNSGNNYATKSLLIGKEKAWWKLVAVIVGILACMGAVILIRKIRRRR